MTTAPYPSVVPPRTLEQRIRALEHANRVRVYRANLKRDLKAGRLTITDVLFDDGERLATELLATAHVLDFLLATPKVGRVKANKVLVKTRISPSKTIGGLTHRQRSELLAMLGPCRRP